MFCSIFVTDKFKNKRLDIILVETNSAQSRQKAFSLILNGNVFIGQEKLTKPGQIIKKNQIIRIRGNKNPWVSRGGVKLEKAINFFNVDVEGKVCLDLGCSTGGFSDVLLKNDAKKIFAVDVGYGQFDWRLRNSKKIVLFEKTNARYLNSKIIAEKIDLVVCDVSFISLKKVIEPCIKLLKNKFKIISLIKPQFETEKKFVGKGGIIKDKIVHKQICDDIYSWFYELLKPDFMKIIESPVMGQKGNKEFLIYLEVK